MYFNVVEWFGDVENVLEVIRGSNHRRKKHFKKVLGSTSTSPSTDIEKMWYRY